MGLNKRIELEDVVTGVNKGNNPVARVLIERYPQASRPLHGFFLMANADLWLLAEGKESRRVPVKAAIKRELNALSRIPGFPVDELVALRELHIALVTQLIRLHS